MYVKKINLDLSIVQSKENIVSDMNGEKVMLSIKNGKYYNLGKMGGEIWDHIEIQTPIYQLIQKLMSDYQVEQAICEEHVCSFVEMLLEEGLIEVTIR
jgi:hypothetical protein